MGLTYIGLILAPLCAYLLLANQKALFRLAVFSIPFTGTAFFMLQSAKLANDERGVGIRVSLVLFLLLFIFGLLKAIRLSKFRIPIQARVYLLLMIALVVIVMLSQLMPLYISGSFNVVDSYSSALMHAEEIPLYYDVQWATQSAYFIFGCFVSIFLVIYLQEEKLLIGAIRAYLYATIFVAAWGLLEWLLYQLEVIYPYYLFNHVSANWGGSMVLNGFVRITSVGLEPSILAQQLITALPFFLYKESDKNAVIPPLLRKIGGGMIVAVLLLSTSATAYIGLAFVFTAYLLSIKKSITYRGLLVNLVVGTMFLIALVLLSDSIYELVTQKLNSYSGKERMMSIVYAITYFINYPVLGIGWGVMPSWDLFFCLLAGAGILGLVIMSVLLATITISLLSMQNKDPENDYLRRSSLLSFLSLLLVSQVSGFIYHALYFWFILGFVIAVIVHISRASNAITMTHMHVSKEA